MSQAGTAGPVVIGLALGGGGALGAAHVGVLKALQECGILPSVVAGTSAGSLIGAAYAARMPVSRIEELVRAAGWSAFGRLRPSPRLGLLDSTALLDTIDRLGGEPLIEDLPRRFAAVATDLRTRQAVVLDRGRVGIALRASIAVPGMFAPVITGERVLVDGGLAANLPIDAARQLGATFTIGVRLRPEWEHIPVVRSAQRIAALEKSPEVLMVRPHLNGFSQWSRADVPRIIEAGYTATLASLETWKDQQPRVA